MQICTVTLAGGLRQIFLLICYVSTKNLLQRLRRALRQNHFVEKNCYNASIIQKNCTDVSGKIYVGAVIFCVEPFSAALHL
jgi:hypothetical protein